MKRRDFLKNLGVVSAGAVVAPELAAKAPAAAESGLMDIFNPERKSAGEFNTRFPIKALKAKVSRPLKVVIIGAGNRGRTYSRYAQLFPEVMQIVGVSDINPHRKEAMAKKFNVAPERRYGHYDELLSQEMFADAAIICTPDNLHFDPCIKALDKGYDVILEKPMAQTEKECRAIYAKTKQTGRIVAVCHVLRYAPYFLALHDLVQSGEIGDVVSIQHMEPIAYWHMAHSYVRGNWHDSKKTTPIILAKSCHDLDIIRWIVNKPCQTIVADGSLYLFKKENAPKGAPLRCTDGCPHEATCPFSAIDIYKRKKLMLKVFDLPDQNDENAIVEKLKTTNYGRCVFHSDNDQPDHYVCNMVFEGGITSSFTMDAFTPSGGRRTRIMGTKGFIDGDSKQFTVTYFGPENRKTWNLKVSEIAEYAHAGHGGGDLGLVRDFLEAVDKRDDSHLSSNIKVSLESHVMGFAAEKSRRSGKKEKIKI